MKKKKMGKGLGALLEIYNSDDMQQTVSVAESSSEEMGAADIVEKRSGGSGLATLRTSMIEPDRSQPRTQFDEEAIEELAQSISQHGILQPILVRPIGDSYRIVAGERRWRAAMKAKLREVPVIIREMTELEAMQIALIENLQRESLNPIEEALGYKRLLDEFSMTQEQIAQQVSKSRSVIANSLRLLKLPDGVRQMLSQSNISVGHAKVLAGVEDGQTCEELALRIKDEKLSVRELERLIADSAAKKSDEEEATRKKINKILDSFTVSDAFLKELELSMGKVTQGKVKISQAKNGKLHMGLEFKDIDELRQFAASIASIAETE